MQIYKGSFFILNKFIDPAYEKYHNVIDNYILDFKHSIKNVISSEYKKQL